MPAKKTTTTAKKAEKATTAKKTTTKTTAKKETATKKPVTKKTATKKVTEKKTTTKKEAVVKQTAQKYIDVINWKKWEAHHMDWLYIEVNAGDLNTEIEAGVSNLKTCCEAMYECMLEGDEFIAKPKTKTGAGLTVRYYVDNLSEDRRKYSEVAE